jgi:hypothetical protein
MNNHQRIQQTIQLGRPDRAPILGGWLAAPGHIQALAGCTEDEYYADPYRWEIEAEHVLGSDALIDVYQPISREEYRIIDHAVLDRRAAYTVDSMLAELREKPDVDELRAAFDPDREYTEFTRRLRQVQADCGDIVWMPAFWDMLPIALWYHTYGYETIFEAIGLHPQEYRKLIHTSAETARQKAVLLARAYQEGLHPGAVLTGEDICSQRGPMVSPAYLRKEYWPLVEYAWEPLKAAGVKVVWHCDGDVRPILADILAAGADGLQGFQRACGMDLEWIVNLRARSGDPLLIFGPMDVVTTFRLGTPDEIRAEVRKAMDQCRGKAGLFFFTGNTITPDIPLENVRAYWDAVRASRW